MKSGMIKFIELTIALLCLCQSAHGMQALARKQQQITAQKIPIAPLSITFEQIFLINKDIQRDGVTCGPRSVYLAAALERVFLQKKEITNAHISGALKELNFQFQMSECKRLGQHESDQFKAYIEFIRHNYAMTLPYLFSLNNDPQYGLYIGMPSSNKDPADVALQRLKTQLANNTLTFPIHFVCNIGGHWVSFSVTLSKDQITLWYIDPMNSGISETTKNIFGKYICEELGLQPSI